MLRPGKTSPDDGGPKYILGLAHIILLLSTIICISACGHSDTSELSIKGLVRDENGPVAGAVVRIQTTDIAATTASDGSFRLTGLKGGGPFSITAFATGYYIAGGEPVSPGAEGVIITLVRHGSEDNAGYQWISAFASEGKGGNCQNCHADPDNQNSALPFDEWRRDAHGMSGQNMRFLTMYRGIDINGNQSPNTRYGFSRDYGSFPLRPDLTKPYFGPGYKLDFPSTAGNCAACHMPAASVNAPYGTDPLSLSGVGSEGVACDFCHKVWDVKLDPAIGLPYPHTPGVLSFDLRRPSGTHQFFAGPYDDVAPGEDTYSPLQRKSQFCAPCHFGFFWDTKIYNSFGEWLESPYSRPVTGKSCQDCHMPQGLTDHFARIDKGGKKRSASAIFSHRMPGASDETLLQNAVTMTASGTREGDQVTVEVNIVNDKTGHHVPTDSPLRHMILLVEASDSQGQPLSLQNGQIIPDWGGIGDPSKGYYGGKPGKAFAKVLMELWTEVSPTGAYWNHTRVISDNRIAAFASDKSTFTFSAPAGGDASIKVTLLFRRAFKALMDQKGWDTPDIVMVQKTITLR